MRGCRKRIKVSYSWPSEISWPPHSHPFTFLSVTALVAGEPRQESFLFFVRAAIIMPRSIMEKMQWPVAEKRAVTRFCALAITCGHKLL